MRTVVDPKRTQVESTHTITTTLLTKGIIQKGTMNGPEDEKFYRTALNSF